MATPNYLLENGDRILLEDSSGVLVTESTPPPQLIATAQWDCGNVALTAVKAQMPASGIQAGDLIVVFFGRTGHVGTGTPAAKWTQVGTAAAGAASFDATFFYATADGTENNQLLDLTTITSDKCGTITYVFRGAVPVPVGGTWSAMASITNPDPPSLTPGWSGRGTTWIAASVTRASSGAIGRLPRNFANQLNDAGALSVGQFAYVNGRQNTSTASLDPDVFTWDSAGNASASVLAIEGAFTTWSQFTLDAIVKKNIPASLTLDAIVKKSVSGSLTADAIVKKNIASSFTADAIVKSRITATLTLDAGVKAHRSSSATLDAIVKATRPISGFARGYFPTTPADSFQPAGLGAWTFSDFALDGGVAQTLPTGKTGSSAEGIALPSDPHDEGFYLAGVWVSAPLARAVSISTHLLILALKGNAGLAATFEAAIYTVNALGVTSTIFVTPDGSGPELATSFGVPVLTSTTITVARGERLVVEVGANLYNGTGVGRVATVYVGDSGADLDSGTTYSAPGESPYITFSPSLTLLDGTLGLDAIVRVSKTGSTTLDAWVKVTVARSLTLDATVKATVSGSLTLNAIVKAAESGSATLNAIVKASRSSSFVLDAQILAHRSGTLALDAIVKASRSGSFTLDALGQVRVAGAVTLDAVVRTSRTQSITLDAVVLAHEAGGTPVDAVVRASRGSSWVLDAVVKRTGAASATLDAVVRASLAGSATLNAIVRSTRTQTYSIDAIVKASRASSATLDAVVATGTVAQSGSFSADALVRVHSSGTLSLDAIVRVREVASTTVDASVRASRQSSATADAITLATRMAGFSLDAIGLTHFVRTASVNAEVAATGTASFTIGAIVRATRSALWTLNGIVRTSNGAQAVLDAYTIVRTVRAFSLDANALARPTRSFTLDASVVQPDTIRTLPIVATVEMVAVEAAVTIEALAASVALAAIGSTAWLRYERRVTLSAEVGHLRTFALSAEVTNV